MKGLVKKPIDQIALIKKLVLVIEDFMPNIGKCVLQDYQRLNEALCEAAQLIKKGIKS